MFRYVCLATLAIGVCISAATYASDAAPVQRKLIQNYHHGALSGHSVTLSPGHGLILDGDKWDTQRPVYGAPLNEEDYHNVEIASYLKSYLESDGMTVRSVRCMDKKYGDYAPGKPWWKMASCYWLKKQGYPDDVCLGRGGAYVGDGQHDHGNDICCRPLASNFDNTDIYISLHTNGLRGDTYEDKPSGTETYYDAGEEHAQWGEASKVLATCISDNVFSMIRTHYDPTWSSPSAEAVKNSDGNYGEIRIPTRPAILLELGFHDTCNRDAKYLRDNYFRSVAMWGMYKGVCDYFKVKPTWDFYSCEYFSDTIPAKMVAGKQYNASITLRNRGVLWQDARQFKLGENGDKAINTASEINIGGEVAPGETHTFKFTMIAPQTSGTYKIDWQMLHDGNVGFGPVVSRSIKVYSPKKARIVKRSNSSSRKH